ncbi:hypothetical protein TNCV_1569711 [Trichonephila clavipes]|uniref:Uncharacterized protein n=1 Tax=Trichonephila clavipes TaxID=2585209 RepID=A0A8X6VNN4_TRICX|nr:hypothetical protein TNCV_1569711 [Trichonephila clavipes]
MRTTNEQSPPSSPNFHTKPTGGLQAKTDLTRICSSTRRVFNGPSFELGTRVWEHDHQEHLRYPLSPSVELPRVPASLNWSPFLVARNSQHSRPGGQRGNLPRYEPFDICAIVPLEAFSLGKNSFRLELRILGLT